MDALLVNGIHFCKNNTMPQLGSICLYEKLKKIYDVDIVNFDYLFYKGDIKYSDDMEENINLFAKYILQFNPKIVQFYTICISYPLMLLIAEEVKKLNKDIVIIMGGPQVTSTPAESLSRFEFIDVIGLGEGEPYICTLVDALLNKKSLKDIRGIAFKSEGQIYINNYDKVVDASELGVYTKFDFQKYIDIFESIDEDIKNYEFQLEAGRGCPFNCTFCSSSIFWKRKFRVKSAERIIDEIKFFHNKYGFLNFSLDHDMFTANKSYLMNFCKLLIESTLNIKWGCSSRLDVLDDEMLIEMKKSNCNSIYVGFESGSQVMQKSINKNLDIEQALKTIKKIKDLGMKITVSFIYGFPEEKESDFLKTIEVIEKLYALDCENIQLHKYFPLPSTNEKEKIDTLYFDEDDIDLAIYNNSIYKGSLDNLIKKDKEIFSAFYSFNSIVREKYRRMDFLITFLNIMKKYFKKTIEYLISKKGLVYIYSQCESDIIQAYKEVNNRSLNEYLLNYKEREILQDLFVNIFNKMTKCINDIVIKEIFRFENILYQYGTQKIKEDKIYFFEVDVLEIEKGNSKCEEKICFVKFEKKSDEILVKKLKINNK